MKFFFIVFIFLSLFTGFCFASESLLFLPKNTEVVYSLRHLDVNPAWSELLEIYQRNLSSENKSNELVLTHIFQQFKFKTIAGGLFKKENLANSVLIIQPQLAGETEQFNRFLLNNLGSFVSVNNYWQKKGEEKRPIYFDNRGEANEKLTSFCVQDDQIILASNSNLISKCVFKQDKNDNVAANSLFKNLLIKGLSDYDGLFFVNNQQKKFSQELKKWESENKIVVLLSSDYLEAMLITFKLLSSDAMKGRIVFKCNNQTKISLVKADAEFLGEVFRRKYSYAQLAYKNNVLVEGDKVILNFETSNFKAILTKELK